MTATTNSIRIIHNMNRISRNLAAFITHAMKGHAKTTYRELSVERCNIFDLMANYMGFTVLHPGGLKATKRLAESCRIDQRMRVLDIACGKGNASVYLAKQYGCSVVGIDTSEDFIAQAATRARRNELEGVVGFHVADALDMPFSDDEFDVAITQSLLVWVSDEKRAIQEALRVTKRGGYVGWLELTWKKQPTAELLETASSLISPYHQLKARTVEGWESLFMFAGVKQLEIITPSMKFKNIGETIADEGLVNTAKVLFRYLTNHAVRKRINAMEKFLDESAEYLGFGIYIGNK